MTLPHDQIDEFGIPEIRDMPDPSQSSARAFGRASRPKPPFFSKQSFKAKQPLLLIGGLGLFSSIGISAILHNNIQAMPADMLDYSMQGLRYWPIAALIGGLFITLIACAMVLQQMRRSNRLEHSNLSLREKNVELNLHIKQVQKLTAFSERSEREHRAILNAIHDVIFELGPDGNLSFINQPWERLTGYKIAECQGRPLFDYLSKDQQELQRRNFLAMLRGQKAAYQEQVQLQQKDGSLHTVTLNMLMLHQDEQKNLKLIGTISSQQERIDAEQTVQEAERRYRVIWENSPVGLFQLTPQGRYLAVNPAMASLLGYSAPSELKAVVFDASEQIYVDSRARRRFLEQSLQEHDMRGEFQCYKQDGNIIWVAETIRAVVDHDGTPRYYEGTFEDITDRKQADMELQKAKWESDLASRAKTEFLSNISHELRTPLNSIIGFSEIISTESLGPIGDKKYIEYANEILDGGKRLLRVITQILDISKIDARRRDLNESVIKMDNVVKTVLDLLNEKLKEKEIVVHNRLDANVPDLIAEELAIRQVLFNLLQNAVKFTPDKGQIVITALQNNDGSLRVSITDTGIGLSDDDIAKAMTPFGLVETRHDRENYGVGLGLTLSRMLMEIHDGALELSSQKGLGTTATLVFPPRRVRSGARLSPNFGAAHAVEQGNKVEPIKLETSLSSVLKDRE